MEEELRRASRHILRIKLDLHKILCVWFAEEYQIKFPNRYANVPLDTLIVNEINFQTEFSKILMKAMQLTRSAKTDEIRLITDKSLEKYEIALLKFRELEQFVQQNEHHLIELRRRYKKSRTKDHLIGFLAGLVSSAIIAGISLYFSKG
ncbi:MAG: hypothetical protein M3Q56_07430 [Bacteroidota bacterium]|nr:hypothetical protein [Bacteroidota bacterium]